MINAFEGNEGTTDWRFSTKCLNIHHVRYRKEFVGELQKFVHLAFEC